MQSIVGTSPWTRRLRAELTRVAGHDSTVLISGPTGTGKELIARAIHQQSVRQRKAFIPVDCTALTSTLFASQLFGHKKGAFTGAEYEALGCFRAAEGGTIFLDEIGELSGELQAKLLRVIQERVVVPVGSHEGRPVDVRIVAATNRDLKQEVLARRFRDDLYFRLAVVVLHTPPLRERPEDIEPLADHLLHELAQRRGFGQKSLDAGARQVLQLFDWPGNVRQLRHVLEQAVIQSDGPVITAALMQSLLRQAMFPQAQGREAPSFSFPSPPPPPFAFHMPPEGDAPLRFAPPPLPHFDEPPAPVREPAEIKDYCWKKLAELERDHILTTLAHTYNNQSAAARLLGVTRQALIRKIKKYAIDFAPH